MGMILWIMHRKDHVVEAQVCRRVYHDIQDFQTETFNRRVELLKVLHGAKFDVDALDLILVRNMLRHTFKSCNDKIDNQSRYNRTKVKTDTDRQSDAGGRPESCRGYQASDLGFSLDNDGARA